MSCGCMIKVGGCRPVDLFSSTLLSKTGPFLEQGAHGDLSQYPLHTTMFLRGSSECLKLYREPEQGRWDVLLTPALVCGSRTLHQGRPSKSTCSAHEQYHYKRMTRSYSVSIPCQDPHYYVPKHVAVRYPIMPFRPCCPE